MVNEVAVITGASSGIGQSYAKYFVEHNIEVIIISNDDEQLKQTKKQLLLINGHINIDILNIDLSKNFKTYDIIKLIGNRKLSYLINNASFGAVGDFLSREYEIYDSMVNLNIKAYIKLTYDLLPIMQQQRSGNLLFTSSLNAFSPMGQTAVYTGTKSFEKAFALSLWYELQQDNINVLVVFPGPTKTNFQNVAGTKVTKDAIEPDDLVSYAMSKLGKEIVCIPTAQNQFFAQLTRILSIKRKIIFASKSYQMKLQDNPNAGLLSVLKNLF